MTTAFSAADPFLELQKVESTNNYATGMVHAGLAQHGTAVFSHHQTAGKGQHNKQWQSGAGQNIAMSVVLQPPGLALSQPFLLSMATAVSVQHFFAKYAGAETKVKWPNDIYWRDRKAAGILIENIVLGSDWKAAIVGIGVNINQTAFEGVENKAVSLKQITGKDHEPLAMAKELYADFFQAYDILLKLPSQTMEEYKNHLYKLNETVRMRQGSRVFEAVIKDVTSLGELIVEHATEERFAVGEVEWLLPAN